MLLKKLFTVAKFEKVSYQNFKESIIDCFGGRAEEMLEETIVSMYEILQLPKRSTKSSAGYDFYTPITFTLQPGMTIKIPSGIRVKMKQRWFMMIVPCSGLGFKYRLRLDNTVGIIDSDYYYSDNEGHIFFKITNESNDGKILKLYAAHPGDHSEADRFAQAIFVKYGLALNDNKKDLKIRNGGLGSTTVHK